MKRKAAQSTSPRDPAPLAPLTNNPASVALTVPEVCAALRLGKLAVIRLIKAKRLHAVRLGRAFRIPPWALEDFLAGREGKRPRA